MKIFHRFPDGTYFEMTPREYLNAGEKWNSPFFIALYIVLGLMAIVLIVGTLIEYGTLGPLND